jgi:hypothetical protein
MDGQGAFEGNKGSKQIKHKGFRSCRLRMAASCPIAALGDLGSIL